MTPEELIVSDLLMEAGRAYVRGTMDAVLAARQRELAKFDGMVVMCGCAEWLTCGHPWPRVWRVK